MFFAPGFSGPEFSHPDFRAARRIGRDRMAALMRSRYR
jgi:hypothetical protein